MAISKTDKHLLNQLMFSLYPEPQTIYREYIQNAADSILEAERSNLIEKNEGHVSVNIYENKQEIRIRDNGKGIKSDEVELLLKSISVSTKRNKDFAAGYFGIGKFVGAGYCQKMIFRTSYYGENVVSELTFDVLKIKNLLDDDSVDLSPNEIIDECTTFITSNNDSNSHFFEVILKSVKPEYVNTLLNEELIRKYLIQIAPIDFKPPFKTALFIPWLEEQEKELKLFVAGLNFVKLTLNDNIDIRKEYKLAVEGTSDEIEKIRFFVLKDSLFGALAWGWYALTAFSTQISETETSKLTMGLRLRIKNILIGNGNFFDGTTYFREPRGNKYFNGEIHVINNNIKPVSDRSDIQPTNEGQAIKEAIKQFCRNELGPVYRKANEYKNVISKYQEAKIELDKTIKDEIHDNSTIKEKQEKQEKQENIKLATAKHDKIKEDLEKKLTVKDNKTNGEKEILEIYKKKVALLEKKTSESLFKNKNDYSGLAVNNSEKTTKTDGNSDIYACIRKKYTEEEFKIIKKIIEIIDINYYSESYKKIINPIKNKILSELSKK